MPTQGYKTCSRCRARKPISEFYRQLPDRYKSACKECERQAINAANAANRAKKRKQERLANMTNPVRRQARNALRMAVFTGQISKPDHCEDCGRQFEKSRIQGHHEDYTKPLEVAWLCAQCHRQRHRVDPRL